MGFRSMFITEDFPIEWPEWFVEKYADFVNFHPTNRGAISSKREGKTYGIFADLHEDIRKVIPWHVWYDDLKFVLVYLHECGGVTRCQIERDRVLWTEPDSWRKTDGVEHDYCSGCSDAGE